MNREHSRALTQGLARAPSRAMMRGAGFSDADLEKPFAAVIDAHNASTTCNRHLADLTESAAAAFSQCGMSVHRGRTPMVTDGTAMGTDVMKYSLPSRDVIAYAAEVFAQSVGADCIVGIGGCDKTTPGMLMAMATLDVPSVYLYGGTIAPGNHAGAAIDIVSMFEGVGQVAQGVLTQDELSCMERAACPGAGACGGMYTANTMAACVEALGMSLPGSSSTPALHSGKATEASRSAVACAQLLELGIRPRDVLVFEAFENAISVLTALGGSTNAVMHLLAIAKRAGVSLQLDDFERIRRRTPTVCDLKPSGRYVMSDLHRVGGVPTVMKMLLSKNLLHGAVATVTGETLARNMDGVALAPSGQDVVRPFEDPVKAHGHFAVVYGNLAPEGALMKLGSWPHALFSGPARLFDTEEAAMDFVMSGNVKKGDVLVTRYEGPRGGPGMREQLAVTAALAGRALHNDVLVVTDGRFSGGTRQGVCHVSPEAQVGGPLALLQDGDSVTLDLDQGTLRVDLSDEELQRRKSAWTPPQSRQYSDGILGLYSRHAASASRGAMLE